MAGGEEQSTDFSKKARRLSPISFKTVLVFLICTTLCVSLVIILIYFFGPILTKSSVSYLQAETDLEPRLPNDIQPLHYRLNLYPNLTNHTYEGRVSILMRCIRRTQKIILNAGFLNLANINITKMQHRSINNKYHVLDSQKVTLRNHWVQDSKLILDLAESLAQNESYLLDVKFSGQIGEENFGFYRSSYTDRAGIRRQLATSNFYQNNAKTTFPCFEESKYKAKFKVSIARTTNMVALSNMPLKETESLNNKTGWVLDHFKTTPAIPTRLLAFTISDFKSVNVTSNQAGPVVQIWSPKHLLPKTKRAVDLIQRLVNFFGNYFQVKYSLPKLDFLIGTDLVESGGLGLITLSDEVLEGDETQAFRILARRISQQWSALDLDLDELWLSEGFALYISYIAETKLQPNRGFDDGYLIETMHGVMESNIGGSLRENNRNFNQNLIQKGACLFRMLNYTIGETNFKKSVAHYFKATNSTFWTSLSKPPFTNNSIVPFINSWKQDGYPLINITRNYQNSTLKIQAKKFGGEDERNYWIVPLTYTSKNSKNTSELLLTILERDVKVDALKNEWVLFNLNQRGFYRVNYDSQNWRLLIEQLEENCKMLPASNRAQIINDAFELAKAGYLDYQVPFRILYYFQECEDNYLPWKTALNSLNYMENIFMDTEFYGIYREYVFKLIPTGNIVNPQNPLQNLLYNKACALRSKACVDNARFDKNLALSEAENCVVIEMGSDEHWDQIWNETLSRGKSKQELKSLYTALGCSRDPWKLQSYLVKTINREILGNSKYVWRSISRNPVGRIIGLKFLQNNYYEILKIPNLLNVIIEELLQHLSSESDLEKVIEFYWKYREDLKSTSFKEAISVVRSKVDWSQKYFNRVLNIMSRNLHDYKVPNQYANL